MSLRIAKQTVFFILISLISLLSSDGVALDFKKETTTLSIIQKNLSHWHLKKIKLDDNASQEVFQHYIDSLDPGKRYFTKALIEELAKDKKNIDNYILENSPIFFTKSISVFKNQLKWIGKNIVPYLNNPIVYSDQDTLFLDPDLREFPKTNKELLDFWRRLLNYQIITKMIELEKKKLPKDDELEETDKSIQTLSSFKFSEKTERKARQLVKNQFQRQLSRLQSKSLSEFHTLYINALSQSYDPHTRYFPPEDKEDFDIGMTGKLEGIGAVLSEEDGYIKIIKIIPGSAASQIDTIEAEDLILKVTQKKTGDETSLIDVPVKEAVKYIRGKKGSTVQLTLQKPSGQVITVSIVRDVVVIEESYAKSVLINDNKTKRRFGYIYLPSFYRDFNDQSSRNASDDLKDHLSYLKTQRVHGIILDLRNNGGGSLKDAVSGSGHFIKFGPIVQVKSPNKKQNTLYDFNPEVVYDGPLIVLVNHYSASASEILAAALQDYNRAIIVGTDQSFGKGTVQTFVDLDAFLSSNQQKLKPLGSLKLSIQKFYRINGGSTQFKGVTPDITLPAMSDYLEVGEKHLPNSLKWSKVAPINYTKWTDDLPYKSLKENSLIRLKNNQTFSYIKSYTKKMMARKKEPYAVTPKQIVNDQLELFSATKKFDSLTKPSTSFNFKLNQLNGPVTQSTKQSKKKSSREKWFKSVKKDIYVSEAIHILNDLVSYYDKSF
tara:strand:- start:4586 stop:6739 length:2154 start_codon:yes stop_codon:yes gene_type:complete